MEIANRGGGGDNKTGMREAAGISTDVLAKVGNNKTVSMRALVQIVVAMECSLGDIIEVISES